MLHGLDVAILLAYVAYSVGSGLWNARAASASLEEYFLAGRSLRGWQAGMSMAATQFAADTPLVVTGLVATAGVFSLWRLWIYALAFLLMALVLGASWRRAGVLTDAQLSEVRYAGPAAAALRGVKAVHFGFVLNGVVLAMVLLAATRITEPFLVWHAWLPTGVFDPLRAAVTQLGVPLTASGAPCGAAHALAACADGAACLRGRCLGLAEWTATTDNVISLGALIVVTSLYSTTGGLRAVVRTDVLQLAIALAGTAAYGAIVLGRVGGLEGLAGSLGQAFPADGSAPGGLTAEQVLAFTPGRAAEAGWAVLGVIGLQWLCQVNADGSGYLAQRTMACRSDADARVAGVVFTVLQVLLRSLLWLPIALGLLLVFPPDPALGGAALTVEREATYVRGIAELLPPGIKGLLLTGMLAALASTLDTHLNWGSSYVTNDLVGRFLWPRLVGRPPSPRTEVWVARLANLLILAIALAILPFLDSIQTAWTTSLLFGAGIGVVLVLRWLWWRMNAAGELAALIASALLAPVLLFAIGDEATRLLLMAGLATAAGIAVGLLTPPEPRVVLEAFFTRARPPGFWGPVAGAEAAPARRRLARSLAATFGGAFSVFCLLVGLGSLVAHSPAPTWLGSRTLWIAALLGLGVGTVPLWVLLGRRLS
ncbi:MAG: sodium transporter [Sandaracinaceae bacterium]